MAFAEAIGLELPYDVLGWNLGAMIALAMAAVHDDIVGSVVSISGAAGVHGHQSKTHFASEA